MADAVTAATWTVALSAVCTGRALADHRLAVFPDAAAVHDALPQPQSREVS